MTIIIAPILYQTNNGIFCITLSITRKQSKIFVLSMYLFYISDKFLVIGTIIDFSNKQEHNTHAL